MNAHGAPGQLLLQLPALLPVLRLVHVLSVRQEKPELLLPETIHGVTGLLPEQQLLQVLVNKSAYALSVARQRPM